MDDPKKTATVTIAVTPEFKAEIQAVAKSKRWSVSQTVGVVLEEFWDVWLDESGTEKPQPTTKKRSKA